MDRQKLVLTGMYLSAFTIVIGFVVFSVLDSAEERKPGNCPQVDNQYNAVNNTSVYYNNSAKQCIPKPYNFSIENGSGSS